MHTFFCNSYSLRYENIRWYGKQSVTFWFFFELRKSCKESAKKFFSVSTMNSFGNFHSDHSSILIRLKSRNLYQICFPIPPHFVPAQTKKTVDYRFDRYENLKNESSIGKHLLNTLEVDFELITMHTLVLENVSVKHLWKLWNKKKSHPIGYNFGKLSKYFFICALWPPYGLSRVY